MRYLVFGGYAGEEEFGADHALFSCEDMQEAISKLAEHHQRDRVSRWQILDTETMQTIFNQENGFPGNAIGANSVENKKYLKELIKNLLDKQIAKILCTDSGQQKVLHFFHRHMKPGESIDDFNKRVATVLK